MPLDLTMFTPNLEGLLFLLIQIVIPILVGLVTTRSIASSVKAVLLLALTSINQFLSEWVVATGHFDWRRVGYGIVIGFVIAVAVHFGLYKPTGVSGKAQAVGSRP